MESTFINSFRSFLDSSYIQFNEYGNSFFFPDNNFIIHLVPAPKMGCKDECEEEERYLQGGDDVLYLYEDRWWGARAMVQERILTRLERFTSIFARKCKVLSGLNNPVLAEKVANFLKENHSYSSTKCRYRFALEYEDKIVAVATFSEPRPMVRNLEQPLSNVPKENVEHLDSSNVVIFDSYEWIRYASLPGVRVVGGMGRILSAFIEERVSRKDNPLRPVEVMTYSDNEWGNGGVYLKLGFKYASDREPVEHYVNKESHIRYSIKEYSKLIAEGALERDFYRIKNKGSRKFLLQLPL